MTIQYSDVFIYAINKENKLTWLQTQRSTYCDGDNSNDVWCPNKHYYIECIEGGYITEEGDRIPQPNFEHWSNFYSNEPAKEILEVLQYANMKPEDVSALIWIDTESDRFDTEDVNGYIISAEGWSEIEKFLIWDCLGELGDGVHLPQLPDLIATKVWEMLSISR